MKRGKLYGVGLGPGDPELLTLKALRVIEACPVLAFPGKCKEDTIAYKIVAPVAKGLEEKTWLACPVEMTKDMDKLNAAYDAARDAICECLERGEDVAFLTIGDPTVYATYMYVHRRVAEAGYEVEIVSGIPSFCAAAARLNMSLVERSEELHVIPSSYGIEQALELSGTKVLMKAGGKLPEVKKLLAEKAAGAEVYMVENCGMANERIYRSIEEIDEEAGYLTILIVK